MTIEIGNRIPTVDLFVMTADGPGPISSDDLFGGKRVVLPRRRPGGEQLGVGAALEPSD